jgi:hypothetical protein
LSEIDLLLLVLWGLGKKRNFSKKMATQAEYEDFEDHILQMMIEATKNSWRNKKPQLFVLHDDIWKKARKIFDPQDIATILETEIQCVLDLNRRSNVENAHATTLLTFLDTKLPELERADAKLSKLSQAEDTADTDGDSVPEEVNPIQSCKQKVDMLRAAMSFEKSASPLPQTKSSSSFFKVTASQSQDFDLNLKSMDKVTGGQAENRSPFKDQGHLPCRADLLLSAKSLR